ncbi:DUF2345 domain-containing protein, partial [Cupriavidus basilensis]
GALRAAQGLLLSAEAQRDAAGGQLDREAIVATLDAALQLAKALGDYAGQHQGLPHDAKPREGLTDAVRDMGHGANDQANGSGNGTKPLLALSAPDGIAAGTPRTIALGAGEHIDAAAQGNLQLSAGERALIHAGNGISAFAQNGDVRHIAHQGEMLLQAQHNRMRLEAEQSVEISASQQHVVIGANTHLTLICGGAYVKIANGNIEMGMPGTFTVKAGSHNFIGPANADATLPIFKAPSTGDFEARYRMRKTDERAFQGYRYKLMSAGQLLVEGWTSDEGETEHVESANPRMVHAYKTIMREDQRLTEDWRSIVDGIGDEWPCADQPSPFTDDFLDEHAEEED